MSQKDTRTITALVSTLDLRILRISDQDYGYPTVFKLQRLGSLWRIRWWKTIIESTQLQPLLQKLLELKPSHVRGMTIRVSYTDIAGPHTKVLIDEHSLMPVVDGYVLLYTFRSLPDSIPEVVCVSATCKAFDVFVNGYVAFSS